MGNINLAVSGPPELRHAGQIVTCRTHKALALLIYLAIEGRLHARESLIALLWPESDEEYGRTLLRRTPLLLRQALQEQTADAHEKHLPVEHDSLGYNFASGIDLDTQALQKAGEALRERHNAWQGSKRGELVAQLGAAADLYQGSFLEGWTLADAPDFDGWVRLQREIRQRRPGLVFDRFSWRQHEGGEFSAALETTIRWMALDLLNETTYQRLVQSYLAIGNPGATLRAYASYRSILAEQIQRPMHWQNAPAGQSSIPPERTPL